MHELLASKVPAGIEVKVERAVITVPAYFDAPQIEATRRAGELAGLEVLGVLQEPTAAAIYHTWLGLPDDDGSGLPRNFLVYDLGGGTFDVSVVRCIGGEYQVLAIDGDNFLGGDDFDRRYAERLRKALIAKGHSLDLDVQNDAQDRARFLRLVHVAQEVKEGLSTSEVLSISKQDLFTDKAGESVSIELEIGRGEYEEAIADLVKTTILCAERALARSMEVGGVGIADIDNIILVGGSTRVPAVMRAVHESLSLKTKYKRAALQTEVDTIVALGAAIFAAQQGGLVLGAGEGAATSRLRFRSPLVSASETLQLAVDVEAAAESARRIEVRIEGSIVAESGFTIGTTTRLEVPLGDAKEVSATLTLSDLDDRVLQTFPVSFYRGEVRKRASSLSQPTVVAKDISVEVARGGGRGRKVLIPRGTSLPVEVTHELATGDRSGTVVVRLLQNRLPIKTLALEVSPDLPIGTPVTITLRCDEAMRLDAKAIVAGVELWARVEGATTEANTSQAGIEQLLAEAESAARSLWGHDGQHFRRESESLLSGLREVFGTDPDKLQALAAQLRTLIDDYAGRAGEEMTPPRHRFQDLVDAVRRTVFSQPGSGLLGIPMDTWQTRIDDLAARGDAAWDAGDQNAWRRVHNEAQALYETTAAAAAQSSDPNDPERIERSRMSANIRAMVLQRQLDEFVFSTTEEVRKLQAGEINRLRAVVDVQCIAPLATFQAHARKAQDLRRDVERIHDELTKVETALERVPSMGLVTERR